MACNSCHNHGGGSFDESSLKTSVPHHKSIFSNPLLIGGLILGAVIIGKKL
jgi:hypothetical protein